MYLSIKAVKKSANEQTEQNLTQMSKSALAPAVYLFNEVSSL